MTEQFSRKIGSKLRFDKTDLKLVANVDFETVRLRSAHGEFFDVKIDDIGRRSDAVNARSLYVDKIREAKHERFLVAFHPVLPKEGRTSAKVKEAAARVGLSRSSGYACLARYDLSGDTHDLPPPTRPGGRGKTRLANPEAEKIIGEELPKVIQGIFRKPAAFIVAVNRRMSAKGLTVAESTLRNRFNSVSSYVRFRARKGRNEAERQLDPKTGRHPEVPSPFDMIQIDHWKTDVEILDESRLHVIGRAWLTVAIDVYSRMIWGWHLGLDAPGSTPLALCMISGLTPKTQILQEFGLDYKMPMSGKIRTLHADNAKEFRGNTIKSGCDAYGIVLRWRPVKKPQYGQYIERYNGTLASALKTVPGATGSSPEERKELKPEETAAFTLADLRKHICMIINAYHHRHHTGIGMTPIDKFTSYFVNNDGTQKRAYPSVLFDTLKLRLNWYPFKNCSVRQTGLRVDYLDYYGESILDLVRHRKDLEGQVQVRRDPFDIRHVYVKHPKRNEWLEVPCANTGCPAASLHRLREAKREAHKRNRECTPETLFELIREQDAHISNSREATKNARRAAARDKDHKKIRQRSPTHSRPVAQTSKNIVVAGTPVATDSHDTSPRTDWASILSKLDQEENEQ